MQDFMNRDLPKYYDCPCGRKKKIKWENKKDFQDGLVAFAIGHSKCSNFKCRVLQVHYSGDPFAIQDFIDSKEHQQMEIFLNRPYH